MPTSGRDWRLRTPTMTMGKSFDTHQRLGPWLVTVDDFGDPHRLGIRTYVDDELRQDGNTGEIIYDSSQRATSTLQPPPSTLALPRSSNHSTRSGPDRRPLVVRTSGSASEGIYGLILAISVIAVSREYDPADAGRVALAVLVTAVVFSLAHVYASALGRGVSEEWTLTRAEVARTLREHWSLVEVVIPLLLVLGLGAIGVIPDRAALAAATVVALVELAAAGGYAAIRHGAGARGTVVSVVIASALGLVVVLLKVLVH